METLAVLLEVFVSLDVPAIATELAAVPAAEGAATVIVMAGAEPTVSDGIVHVTVVVPEQLQPLPEMLVAGAGSEAVSVIPEPVLGPRLAAWIV